jgi:hypothetical protein
MLLIKRIVLVFLFVLLMAVVFAIYALATTPRPSETVYGTSFNTLYARELGLDWLTVYTAMLDDLKVRHLRLAAHWPMVEPKDDQWNFDELDTQLQMAEERGAKVVFAVGRRLPRWPECHVPDWAKELAWEEQQAQIRTYITQVVERYKENTAVAYWQVENEPFLTVFAYEHCGTLDTDFLEQEIALVKELDPTRPVLVTDSGNLGTWIGAYRRGDLFGTSVYVYLFNEQTGPFKTVLPPETYILKRAAMKLLYGEKELFLVELSLEPWLDQSIADAPLKLQLERMPLERMDEILEYAHKTRMERQYLWGAEWWYWLKAKHDHPEYWEWGQSLFTSK